MSNNDLPCDKCGCQHHPVCCPLDMEVVDLTKDKEYMESCKMKNSIDREKMVKFLIDKFPFEYKGGGAFRKKGVPKGTDAKTIHGSELPKYIVDKINSGEFDCEAVKSKGCKCQSCDNIYSVDLVVNDWVWEKISPKQNEAGLLCPNCIATRISELGLGKIKAYIMASGT